MKQITEEQYEILSAYCCAYSEMVRATNELDKDGRNAVAKNGYPVPSPAVQRQRSAWQAINQLSQRLGIIPNKLATVPVPDKWKKHEDQWWQPQDTKNDNDIPPAVFRGGSVNGVYALDENGKPYPNGKPGWLQDDAAWKPEHANKNDNDIPPAVNGVYALDENGNPPLA
ncbi:hypothetical protein AYO44_14180 [Planctomycetaceae bacterium SCGC AG-212-F19]|nr:hypothetical protein AYO44_14180 [Planctomycetaceae bacterium SCGC AG-212-F19]